MTLLRSLAVFLLIGTAAHAREAVPCKSSPDCAIAVVDQDCCGLRVTAVLAKDHVKNATENHPSDICKRIDISCPDPSFATGIECRQGVCVLDTKVEKVSDCERGVGDRASCIQMIAHKLKDPSLCKDESCRQVVGNEVNSENANLAVKTGKTDYCRKIKPLSPSPNYPEQEIATCIQSVAHERQDKKVCRELDTYGKGYAEACAVSFVAEEDQRFLDQALESGDPSFCRKIQLPKERPLLGIEQCIRAVAKKFKRPELCKELTIYKAACEQ